MMTESPDDQRKLSGVIKSLSNKANMQATCHSIMCDRHHRWHLILVSAILVFSALSVGMTFISDQFVLTTTGIKPDTLKWTTGLTSILTFTAGLLLSQWDFAGKAADHRAALRHYFAVVNRARYLLGSSEEITETVVNELRSEYERTEALPKIPESQFLKLKQYHLRKVAASRELDKTPHTPLCQIRKRLREQESSLKAARVDTGANRSRVSETHSEPER